MPRSSSSLDVVIIGLAITSSWGNGHATTYRALLKGLARRGHRVTFLECDQPWYAAHRDEPSADYCRIELYRDRDDLRRRFGTLVRNADAVIVGSYVDDGRAIVDWVLERAQGVRAFYDIDTPVTLRGVRDDSCSYLAARQIPAFDLILSFACGPILRVLREELGAQRAEPLCCSVDPDLYAPHPIAPTLALAYMGTYSPDRQAGLERFLNATARALPQERFMVVGPQYPTELSWPDNVLRVSHLAPRQHARFYSSQRFTLNITRADMRAAGHSPSVRMFEAAACAVPIISDDWPGLAEVFRPGEEILLAQSSEDIVDYLSLSDAERLRIGARGRERAMAQHSGERRAQSLERYIAEARAGSIAAAPSPATRWAAG